MSELQKLVDELCAELEATKAKLEEMEMQRVREFDEMMNDLATAQANTQHQLDRMFTQKQ